MSFKRKLSVGRTRTDTVRFGQQCDKIFVHERTLTSTIVFVTAGSIVESIDESDQSVETVNPHTNSNLFKKYARLLWFF